MMNNVLIKDIQTLSKDTSFLFDTAQVRAKALLKEVTGEIPDYKWSYQPKIIIRNISAALFSLEILAEKNPTALDSIGLPARQFALIWESLAKLEECTRKDTALINSAVAYELAGYQANASCLAKALTPLIENESLNIRDLSSLFLQRLFLKLNIYCREMKEPSSNNDELLKEIGTTIAAFGFNNTALFMLNGNTGLLDSAFKCFKDSETAFANAGLIDESILMRHVRCLLPIISQRSTWTVLGHIHKENLRWRRYLKLLARGLGQDTLNSPSISELWPSQLQALSDNLLTDESKVVKMPTSAGKTRVAELAIAHALIESPGCKCVYIAPYRALVSELEASFLNLFGDLGYFVSSVIGSYETNDFEETMQENADIIVMTPERLDLLQRAQPDFLNSVRLIVLDEGQIVQDRSRGVKFELLLTRLKRRLPKARFLFLSAVVPEETLHDFAAWFNANPDKGIIKTEWRPSILRVAKFRWNNFRGVIQYSPQEDIPLLNSFVSGIIESQVFKYFNFETRRQNQKVFPNVQKKNETAAELAYRLGELGPILVFCSQPSYVKSVAVALETRLRYSKNVNQKIPEYFDNCKDTQSSIVSEAWLGSTHWVTELLKKGIAVHHGHLPDALRKAVEEDFKNRKYRILIATNTLAQGVNLPIKTVIVHSCWRQRAGELPEKISARDYWNIAGRAGRAGRETEGTIIHIVMNGKDERDYNEYLKLREKVEHVQSALFTLLVETVVQRLSPAALSEILDPEVLALMVEEKVETLTEQKIQDILNQTLFKRQAERILNIPEKVLVEGFENASAEIKKRVPDSSYWPTYSSTGLRSSSCEILKNYIVANQKEIKDLLCHGNTANLQQLIEVFLQGCSLLPEMHFGKEFHGDYPKLLAMWLNGTSITELSKLFKEGTSLAERLVKTIEEQFTFRLPWGMMAILRIAMKTLSIENRQLSMYTKFFPTMVKFGVPSPAATWAISSGIPLRKSAIKIAEKYLAQTSAPDFKEFGEWLRKLHSEELNYDFGFKGRVLEDVSKAVNKSGINEILHDHSSITEILPFETQVKGIFYENRGEVAVTARIGQIVELCRDYKNHYDHNAIKVWLEGRELGYIQRDLAQLIAPDIDCGLLVKGIITNVGTNKLPEIKIRLELA